MAYKTIKICTKVITGLIFLLNIQSLNAQKNWSKLDEQLVKFQKPLGTNVVCLISDGNSILYQKEMGNFTAETVQPIASCSKWLTATLVMQFVDDGKLNLNDKVSKYIPSFNIEDKKDITIQQTLSHLTGISSNQKNLVENMIELRKYKNLEEEVDAFAKRKMEAKPGASFSYSSVGLNTAARVLEVISGKDFETLIQEKLFNPLEMNHTSFSERKMMAVNPSGGAQSTALDYMKFLQMLLNNGQYKGKQILSAKAVAQMRIVQNNPDQIDYAPENAEGALYASGSWVMERQNSEAPAGKISAYSLASPGLFGTWPTVDFCNGYASIIFVKNLQAKQRSAINKSLKRVIDEQFANKCK